MVSFEGKKSSNDIIINDTMSEDEVQLRAKKDGLLNAHLNTLEFVR